MGAADTLSFPVGLELNDANVQAVINELEAQLRARFGDMLGTMSKDLSTFALPKISAQATVQQAGKQFQVSSQISASKTPTVIRDEAGNVIASSNIKIATQIKEIKQQASKILDLDVKRLVEFKKSLKHQPLEIKQTEISNFIKESQALQDSLKGQLPTDQFKQVRQFIEQSKTFSPALRQESIADFNKLEVSISTLSADTQSNILEAYVKRFTDQTGELKQRLDNITGTLRRKEFKKIKLQNVDLPFDEQIKVFEDFAKPGQEFSLEAKAFIARLKQKQAKQQFRRIKFENVDLPVEEYVKVLRNFSNTPIAKELDIEIKKELERIKRKTNLDKFQNLRLKKSIIPVEEYVKSLEELANNLSSNQVKLHSAIQNEIQRIKQQSAKQQFKDIQVKAIKLPVEERIKALEDFVKTDSGKPYAEQIQKQIAGIRSQSSRQQFRDIKLRRADLPLNLYLNELQKLADTDITQKLRQDIILESHKARDSKTKINFNRLKLRKSKLSFDDYVKALESLANSPISEGLQQQINQEIAKVKQQTAKAALKKVKVDSIDKPIADRIAAIEAFAKTDFGKQLQDDVNQEITRLKSSKSKLAFSDVKLRNSGKPIEEQIKALQDLIASGILPPDFVDRANQEIGKLSGKFVAAIKANRGARFRDFTKQVQILSTNDPQAALNLLDDYISRSTSAFINDARLIRDRLQKSITSARQQQQKDRSRNFSNLTLLASGAGLGLLGPAGFPLLNVGFAAMSGGPVGAAIVGAATGIGELTRALGRMRDETVAAARELGFISTNFKIAEARMKALDAFIGSSALSSQQAGLEEKLRLAKENIGASSEANRFFSDVGETASLRWDMIKTKFGKLIQEGRNGRTDAELIDALQLDTTISEDFRRQRMASKQNRLGGLQSELKNAELQFNKITVGIESDPFETFKRIQNAAFDAGKSEEIKVQRELIKVLRELVRAEEARIIKDGPGALIDVGGKPMMSGA